MPTRVPAGLFDSGTASLAAFLAGLIAIWSLDPAGLGLYAIFYSAFLAGTYATRHYVFIPIEMASIGLPRSQRTGVLRWSLRVGIGPALLGATAISLAAAASFSLGSPDLLMPLTITATLATFLSPFQDHVRRILHLSDRSWTSALISIVQLLLVGIQAVLLASPFKVAEVAPGWLPFGVLVTANLISLAVGVVASRPWSRSSLTLDLRLKALSKPGRWLLLSAFATKGSSFAAAILIASIAGAEVLGYAEAARVVAQPLMVLGIGLQDAMSPRFMEAGRTRDQGQARLAHRSFLRIFSAFGIVYLGIAAFDWAGNPMSYLVPQAYEVAGLVAVSIVANVVASAVYPYRLELYGGNRSRSLALVDVFSAIGQLLLALTASLTLSFARPLGRVAQGGIQFAGYRVERHQLFRPPSNISKTRIHRDSK